MIHIIEQVLRNKITALPFIERYGGVAYPLTSQFPGQGDIIKTFPVSTTISSNQCFHQDKYKNLIPDDRYKSLSYLEGLANPVSITFDGPKKGVVIMSQTLRFVCWLNLPKLGFTDLAVTSDLAIKSIDALSGEYAFTYKGTQGRVSVKNSRSIFDRQQVFGLYSYFDKQAVFMYPYSFFAIELQVTAQLGRKCIDELVINDPINCITEW
jgi:hypothetical protein